MKCIPTPEEALELIKKYNSEDFHLEHAQTVSGVMGIFAKEHDPDNVEYWKTVGMLHDIDFEKYPDEHCTKAVEILNSHDVDESIIRAIQSHGYGICSDVAPERYMEKVLYAVDELTGLIGAAVLMRPTGISDLEAKSVVKKYKSKSFAAGCSREVIAKGAKMLDMELKELIALTIEAMKKLEE